MLIECCKPQFLISKSEIVSLELHPAGSECWTFLPGHLLDFSRQAWRMKFSLDGNYLWIYRLSEFTHARYLTWKIALININTLNWCKSVIVDLREWSGESFPLILHPTPEFPLDPKYLS